MSWKSFGLGAGAGVLGLLVAAGILLMTISSPAGQSPAPALPGATTTGSPGPTTPVDPGETWLDDVDLSSSAVLTADGPLRDIAATGSGVTLSSDGLRAEELEIMATLPYETAAQQMDEGIELYPAGEFAGLRRTVEVLGRQIDIDATGRVSAENGQLVIEPETVSLGSAGWIDSLASATVRSLVTIRHTVTGLPAGMRLDAVAVQPDGFRVELSGTDVEIGQQLLSR